jgi:CheY-like chemotaxis protein
VLGNLLHNGWKFTEQGGTIAVKLEGMGGEAVLSVRDTGIGMTPDVLHHIFEPFSQGHTSLDRSQGGLGLGLALVKGMVELHSGAIDARSEGAGCGSEFIVRLPLATAQAVSGSSAPDQTKLSCHYRILIIEDNRLAARSSQMILEQSGHTVEVTHSGPHGIQAARRFRPEVVLCDIGLPGLDGYTVARVLRQDEGLHGSFLIAVSGYAEDERRLREAGFNAHLTKPIDFADLERLLATLAAENSTLATPVETRAKSTTPPL